MPIYTVAGVEVEFPYEAYDVQLEYMASVINALSRGDNALLESPTGTGKTLCLLSATLAWREHLKRETGRGVDVVQQQPHASSLVQGLREAYAEYKAERAAQGRGPGGSGLPLIVYSSRTHSQLAQVMRELRKCSYKHPVVKSQGAGINQACRALVSRNGCKWHHGVERFAKHHPDANAEVLDIEDLVQLGEARALCPYYLSRELSATADIVLCPYNYLVTPATRAGLGLAWEGAVVIFDEAHNIEGVCSDASSFDLPAAAIGGAIEELGTAAELAEAKGDTPINVFNELGGQAGGQADKACYQQLATQLRQAQLVLQRLEREVAAVAPSPGTDAGFTAPGIFLFELLAKLNLTAASWPVLSSAMEQAGSLLSAEAVEAGRRAGARSGASKLRVITDALDLAFSTETPLRTGLLPAHEGYRVHVHLQRHPKTGLQSPTLSYWCFWPGQAMQQLAEMKVRSILLTSGTLSPLDSFAHELSLPFPVRLENPHVIESSQVWCGVVPMGPLDVALNSSYANRDSQAYKNDLGLAIANLARLVPDGLLVFFPSYGTLQSCTEAWKTPGLGGAPSIWERISQHKAPVVEPRSSDLFGAACEDYRAKLDAPGTRGAVFFAVMRGKASEGLDFSDRAARAVVITGIPYAMRNDPRVRIKQEVLNETARAGRKRPSGSGGGEQEHRLTGDQWYSQEAMRAVNQALGRVIRHRHDYGAVILCDERYKGANVRRQLSRWLRDLVAVHPSFGSAAASLTRFYKEAAAKSGSGNSAAAAVTFAAAAEAPGRAALFQDIAGGGKSGGGRSLLHQVPPASSVLGIADLCGSIGAGGSSRSAESVRQQQQQQQPAPAAAAAASQPASELEQLLDKRDGAGAASTFQQQQQQQQEARLRPWQHLIAAPLARPGVRLERFSGGDAAAKPAASAIVGPSHLVQQQQQRKQQEQLQRQERGEQREQQEREHENSAANKRDGSTAAAAGVPAKASGSAQSSISSFMSGIAALPRESASTVTAALKSYRQSRQVEPLLAAVVPVLAGQDRLWSSFLGFIPGSKRNAAEQMMAAQRAGNSK